MQALPQRVKMRHRLGWALGSVALMMWVFGTNIRHVPSSLGFAEFPLNPTPAVSEFDPHARTISFLPGACPGGGWVKFGETHVPPFPALVPGEAMAVDDYESEYAWVYCNSTDMISGHLWVKDNDKAIGGPPPRGDGHKFNILMVLLDAVSRDDWYAHLEAANAEIDALATITNSRRFNFDKHNVLGRSSIHNKFPMLSNEAFVSYYDNEKAVDDSVWIWTLLNKAGWATMYGETVCGLNDYPDTFDISVVSRYFATDGQMGLTHRFPHQFLCDVMLHPEFVPPRTWADAKDTSPRRSCSTTFQSGGCYLPYCLGHQMTRDYWMDYFDQFATTYRAKGRPWFAALLFEDFHTPDAWKYPIIDGTVPDTFDRLMPHMDDTIVIFLSDHGIHFGQMYYSQEGSIAHKSPFLNILVPESFVADYPELVEAMEANTDVFTTHYDVFATMAHIGAIVSDPKAAARPSWAPRDLNLIGSSLFANLDPDRSCNDVPELDPYWCATSVPDWMVVRQADAPGLVSTLAQAAVDEIVARSASGRDRCLEPKLMLERDVKRRGVVTKVLQLPAPPAILREPPVPGATYYAGYTRFSTSPAGSDRLHPGRWEASLVYHTLPDAQDDLIVDQVGYLAQPGAFTDPDQIICRSWEVGVDRMYCICREDYGVGPEDRSGDEFAHAIALTEEYRQRFHQRAAVGFSERYAAVMFDRSPLAVCYRNIGPPVHYIDLYSPEQLAWEPVVRPWYMQTELTIWIPMVAATLMFFFPDVVNLVKTASHRPGCPPPLAARVAPRPDKRR